MLAVHCWHASVIVVNISTYRRFFSSCQSCAGVLFFKKNFLEVLMTGQAQSDVMKVCCCLKLCGLRNGILIQHLFKAKPAQRCLGDIHEFALACKFLLLFWFHKMSSFCKP